MHVPMCSLDRTRQLCFIADSKYPRPVSPTNTVSKQNRHTTGPLVGAATIPKTSGRSGSAQGACYWKSLIPATGTTARFQYRLGPGTVQQQQRQLVLAWRGESTSGQRKLDGIDKTRVVRVLVS